MDYLDINHDGISNIVTIVLFWHDAPHAKGRWTETIEGSLGKDNQRVEVGLLQNEKATDPEKVSLGGYLTMVGEDEKSCEITHFNISCGTLFQGD